ncbi:MAG: glycogen-debranching protein [Parachlamydiaceae bacterium]|nr:glycogen-debranching protein [Parachlamydiaceae bacterium]
MRAFDTNKGTPYPFGITSVGRWKNFALFCPKAITLTLCLFQLDKTSLCEIKLDPLQNKTGDVWHIALNNLPLPLWYAYRVDENLLLMDPYAKGTSSNHEWGKFHHHALGEICGENSFDWENEIPLNIPLNELIIYEMHVRAFTAHQSSQVLNPGTFLGLVEKIPYLKNLGINAVELLPIHEFNETDCPLQNPKTQRPLCNFWGYSTLNFFAPMNRYASSNTTDSTSQQFKQVVKEFHKHGIEVILDVVFNHTGEGNEKGPTLSFKGLANSTYYIYSQQEGYYNYSGCGNTLNCNDPVVIQMILDCLRYWVVEMHVDGFRFDLASNFYRGSSGQVLPFSPLITAISLDPILANIKLIAEPWDAVGLYQLGDFYSEAVRWNEWNGRYRDTIRRFIKGNPGLKGELATCLSGSQDLFRNRTPTSSINFVTAHDGFSLADLVAYNHKHNIVNGENNHDGSSFNDSWNCGVEGFTTDKAILALRMRQMRNFHLALMISQGVPMLHMGDEYGHTKKGNNNTWCQDNELNWFLWDKIKENNAFYRFYRLMIAFRKQQPLLRQAAFLTDQNIEWHGSFAGKPCWEQQDSLLAFVLKSPDNKEALYIAFNAHDYSKTVQIPKSPTATPWFWVANTAEPSPGDFNEFPEKFPVASENHLLKAYTSIILITRRST